MKSEVSFCGIVSFGAVGEALNCAIAFATLLLVGTTPGLCNAAYPSPADWRDETIYQIITDRWDNGDPSNDTLNTTFNPSAGDKTHGGDFKGLTRRLGYLRGMGITSVWISPIPLNANGEYHGYSARDFTQVDPHWGTTADLQTFVNTAHTSGVRVILDVVCNHGGDLINDNSYVAPPASYTLSYTNPAKQHAAPFTDLSNWHAQGSIGNFTDPEQILGELFGLDDLKTEDATVRTNLINIWSNWITLLDVDGFRIDTVKHVELGFWQTWGPGLRANAATFGKSSFFTFGEVFDGSEAYNGKYTGTKGGGAYAIDSTLDYPLYFQTNSVFATESAGAQNIVNHYNAIPSNYDAYAQTRLVTFLDNHDNARFLSSGLANNNTSRLAAALVFELTGLGVPCVYYGTEQNFNGGGDPYCREDMFAGKFEFGPSIGNNFDQTAAGYRLIRKMNQLRRDHSPLRRGTLTVREVHSSPGIFAYSRQDSGNEVLVVVNTADAAQTGAAWVTGFAAGTVLQDALNPAVTRMVNASQQVASGFSVAANGYNVFVPQADIMNLDPEVVSVNVAPGSSLGSLSTPLVFTFSEAMSAASVESAFTMTTAVAGLMTWNAGATQMTFTPSGGWPASSAEDVTIGEAATATGGGPLRGGFEIEFQTSALDSVGGGSADPTIDGSIAGDSRWGSAVATQAVKTGFGDNTASGPDSNSGGSEADQMFVTDTSTTLYIAISGNLEPNGNAINLVFNTDNNATGANTLDATGAISTFLSGAQSAAGTRMPGTMKANLILQVQLAPANQTLTLNAFTWNAAGILQSEDNVGAIAATPGFATKGRISGDVNGSAYTFDAAYDNSNSGPVTAGSTVASPNGAGAASGLEISIPKSLVGQGPYKLFAGISGSSGFWSNQFLPSITAAANLGWSPNLNTKGMTPLTYAAVPVELSKLSLE